MRRGGLGTGREGNTRGLSQYPAPEIFDTLGPELAARQDLYPHDVAVAVWSLAISSHASPTRTATLETLWRKACDARADPGLAGKALARLAQVQVTLRVEAPELAGLPSAEMQQDIDSFPREEENAAGVQVVSESLTALGWDHEVDARVGDVVVETVGA